MEQRIESILSFTMVLSIIVVLISSLIYAIKKEIQVGASLELQIATIGFFLFILSLAIAKILSRE